MKISSNNFSVIYNEWCETADEDTLHIYIYSLLLLFVLNSEQKITLE